MTGTTIDGPCRFLSLAVNRPGAHGGSMDAIEVWELLKIA